MTKKTQELLAAYKKANKDRRKVIIHNAGCKTEVEYLAMLWQKANKKTPAKKTVKPVKVHRVKLSGGKKANEPIDYVIAFDTTGSMSSYIESVKKHVESVVEQMFKNTPNLRVSIVAFGDYCDATSKTDMGDAYQCLPLTDNKNKVIKFIRGAKNTTGGDGDEFYEMVIKTINEETEWRKGSTRTVLFIGDADPHELGYSYRDIIRNNQIDWEEEAKSAKKLGIHYDTLRIHGQIDWYVQLSKITDGVSLEFKNSAKISNVVLGTTYMRSSSTKSRSAFKSEMTKAFASGDEELKGAYKVMNVVSTSYSGED